MSLKSDMTQTEWLKWRGIGSSDAPIIMGVGFDTPYQLWKRKVFGEEKKDTFAMQHGRTTEPEAIKWFEDKMNISLTPQKCITHSEHNWMTATLDGINEEKKIMVEIKCPRHFQNHLRPKDKEIPEKYYPQLQHQLEVQGYDSMYYVSYFNEEGVVLEVGRDQKYIDKMLDKEKEFYFEYMLNMQEPPLTDKDYAQMKDESWLVLANQWLKINAEMKDLKKKDEELREALLFMANKENSMGGGIKIRKSTCKGAIDYSRIPELQGVDLEKYRKSSFEKFTFDSIK